MMDIRVRSRLAIAFYLSLVATSAMASETVTYTYDAKGRLVKVVRSGTVNNGITTIYDQDKANNRKNLKTTGSSQ